ncbi:hypothetical protein [Gordonia rhizosphera]|uniref:Uncharacterized protein n=1 Tax=Gordonia rhizosphera NBRC 16068 TaxID=1108045 RepID=K6VCM6_9ACTN|nr:hypothetical protein [Gordonia rhizosphera]GAB93968.1 hypothetical protein GORHZ_249_00040 [Gordonia rhizosphera NBRC 16068]
MGSWCRGRGGSSKARRRAAVGALAVLTAATTGAGVAAAIPEYSDPNLATTLRCDSPDPWSGQPIPIRVDVYNQIAFPADGLPGPAISLIASDGATPSPVFEYTISTRVDWRNLDTGRTGSVTVPTRARTVTWQVDLHPGGGRVAFTIHQKIGVMAFVPMVNARYSSCAGHTTA